MLVGGLSHLRQGIPHFSFGGGVIGMEFGYGSFGGWVSRRPAAAAAGYSAPFLVVWYMAGSGRLVVGELELGVSEDWDGGGRGVHHLRPGEVSAGTNGQRFGGRTYLRKKANG